MKKLFYLLLIVVLITGCSFSTKMKDLSNMTVDEIQSYAEENNLALNITYEYNDLEKGKLVSQSITEGDKINKNEELNVVISKGINDVYTLSLAMVGDMLIHSAVYYDARTDDGYDFKPMIELVKPLIQNYDLAFYNQESILGGVDLGLSTYPRFNSPYEVGDAMVDAGFNLVSLANNHTLDRGEEAIINSTNYWKNKTDVVVAGSYQSRDDRDKVVINEKNGITYALLSYTTITNGLTYPSGKDYLVNVYDEEKVKNDIEAIRDKVDVLMVSMHWGSEYTNEPTSEEVTIANYLASLDVDIVIGHHPHVIQPITYIGDTLVVYSLGNFLSGQVGEAKNVGLLASVDITKTVDASGTKIETGNIGTGLIYTSYDSYEANDEIYCSNYKLYPFKDLNDSILYSYSSIRDKYNAIVTRYYDDINVNMFDN
ncbi:MAG: CapA family protein [Bacilli bacterium]|nr:CapA family protein [Bacilli bacterium]